MYYVVCVVSMNVRKLAFCFSMIVSGLDVRSSETNRIAAEAAEKVATDPVAVMNALGKEALDAVNNNPKQEDVIRIFSDIIDRFFSLRSMAKFIFNTNYRRMNAAQKNTATNCLKKMMADQYSARFSDFKGASLKVVGVKKTSDTHCFVKAKLATKKAEYNLSCSMFLVDGSWKVFDVIVDDTSMSKLMRAGIDGSIKKDGLHRFLNSFEHKYANPVEKSAVKAT